MYIAIAQQRYVPASPKAIIEMHIWSSIDLILKVTGDCSEHDHSDIIENVDI